MIMASGYKWAAAVFAALWIYCAYPWLSGSVTIPYDAKALFQAQLQFLASSIHSGQSPAWNPHTFVGVPQIADPQSLIFSPGLLIAMLSAAPSFWSLDVYVFLLLGMSGGSILLFFRDRGWHPGGAAVAAICFAFGGSAAWRLQHISHIQSYAFFALGLWLLTRALDRRSAKWGAMAGLAIGLMLAEPNQVALLACYLMGLVIVVSWALEASAIQAIRRDLVPLAAAAAVVILVAILPVGLTYVFLAGSNRPEIELAEAARGSLHPASLLSLFIADLFGVRNATTGYWGPFSGTWDPNELTLSSNMCQLYIGAIPVLALIVGLARGALWKAEIRGFVLAALAALIYALGTNTPAFTAIFGWLPGVDLFRRPADATFLLGGFLSILAGYLLHLWLQGEIAPLQRKPGWIVGLAVMAVFACAASLAAKFGRLDAAQGPLLSAGFWLACAAAVLFGLPKFSRTGVIAVSMLPALVVGADLAWNNRPSEATGKPVERSLEVLRPNSQNETLIFLAKHVRRLPGSQWRDRIEMLGLGFDWQNAAEAQGFDQTLGYNPLRTDIVTRAIGAGDYIAGPDQRVFSALFPSYRSRLADMLGLRFIASPVPLGRVDSKLGEEDLNLLVRTPDAFVYENPRALPRVLFASASQSADFSRILLDGRWPDFDPRQTVLLDPRDTKQLGPDIADASTRKAPHLSAGALEELIPAQILRYENTTVDVVINAPRPGFVVLNDVWHPWWAATVDGQPSAIRRANVMFRAVAVPAGRHLVQFEFHPIAGAMAELAARLMPVAARK